MQTDLLDGRTVPAAEPIALHAGALRAIFEPDTGFLRYLKAEGREVLRGIYGAVRDHNWGTVPARVHDISLQQQSDGFVLSFAVDCRRADIDFHWRGRITGEAAGRLSFEFDGEARSTFRRNRIGFCVLHPAGCAGVRCRVATTDGQERDARFPVQISPHQPFMDLRAIAHEVRPGLWAHVAFEGDVFEMEDQRNWTDASFKTYCTPLARPFPVQVEAGTRIRQVVRVSLEGAVQTVQLDVGDEVVELSLVENAAPVTLPRIGLGIASHEEPLSERAVRQLQRLRPAHLRVDLRPGTNGWLDALERAADQADTLNTRLEVALFLKEESDRDLAELAERVLADGVGIAHWLVFDHTGRRTTPQVIESARRRLGALAPVGGGSNAYFTELNRMRPPFDALDLVCYSINPQVHAFDNASLIETLPTQATTVESCRALAGGRPVAISPVTLRPRFNPNATGADASPGPDELPSQVDRRQMTLFAAAWTLGSVKHLAEAGAASVTFFETTGWRGVMERETGSPKPTLFPSTPGATFPLYHVLSDVQAMAGGDVRPMSSADDLTALALWLVKDGAQRVLVANYRRTDQRVRLRPMSGTWRLRLLDEQTAAQAMQDPQAYGKSKARQVAARGGAMELVLPPYAVARLDHEA